MQALLFAADTSKVPWFIAGGVLAVYAVVLAYVGLNRPDFPYNGRGERAVIALSTLLAAIAVAMAIISA
jgi:hypothetical protein